MPPIARVTGSPFSNLYRNIAQENTAARGMAQLQDLQALQVANPGAFPRWFDPRIAMAQTGTLLSLARINMQFWIDQIKQFIKSLRETNSLAFPDK